ncbi:cation diffusion facilitator family transporter [Thioclava sp. BHET1]|nr:cation diffusion facilitator family transporter [Thioclava sp. BHET1]
MSHPHSIRLNISAGLASVSVASLLVLLKLWAMSATGALSIAASLADSAMDLMVSLGGLMAMIYAAKPADEDHAFGHSSAEDLAALGQAVFILVTGVAIIWASIARLLAPAPVGLDSEGSGILVMVIAILATAALVMWQRRVAARTGSKVVAADALHYMGDAVFNIGAILALLAARFGLPQIDSVVALGAAAVLILGALRVGKGAIDALMDRRADPAITEGIAEMTRGWPGVRGYHDLKTRTAGSRVFVHLHIELDGEQTLTEAHAIGAALRHAILDRYPQTDVIIHKDVAHPQDEAGSRSGGGPQSPRLHS